MDISKAKEVQDTTKGKMQKALEHLEAAMLTVRAGKANPAIFNAVMVDYYGAPTPLPQVSSITSPDAKTLFIQPWDKNMIAPIEKAIMAANLGFTPQNNGEHVRINVPPLTEERRKELVKQVRAEGETARISIRNARRDGVDLVKKYQKDGLPEDVAKDTEGEIQKLTDQFNKKADEVLERKEKEIMTV
ncbi:MAG: ribosome recycling factor [Prevotellaceae bacterium]|jgi:ribosome recycling factor|nr:ribosome recycling factor [Prevotellaceae bacterium]